MIPIFLTLRTRHSETPCEVQAWSPSATCALAIAPAYRHDSHKGWKATGNWQIVHRPTGFQVGQIEWGSRKEAEAVFARCMPDFPAWLMASGVLGDLATMACKTVFAAATQSVT